MIDLYKYRWNDRRNAVRLAVELARLVLPIFEDRFPDDDRPRKAIEAAEAWLTDLSDRAAHAAHAAADAARAADAAYAAADAAYAHDAYANADAAYAAANAAAHAARAAAYAVDAAYAAANAAHAAYAAYAAADAARAAGNRHQIDRIVVKWIAIDLGVDPDTERGKAVQVALLAGRLDYAQQIARDSLTSLARSGQITEVR